MRKAPSRLRQGAQHRRQHDAVAAGPPPNREPHNQQDRREAEERDQRQTGFAAMPELQVGEVNTPPVGELSRASARRASSGSRPSFRFRCLGAPPPEIRLQPGVSSRAGACGLNQP